ncbi:hypothetical protein [Fibrella aestuarina]|nr:hypothetical protein [Fibrella aestuarina]
MRPTILLVSLLLLLALRAAGQSTSAVPPTKRVYLHSVVGVALPGVSSLNTELSNAGFLPLSGAYLLRGAGLYTVFPKARLATLVTFMSYSGTDTEANRSSWVRGSTAGASLGIVLGRTDRIQCIPYAGLAYAWFGTRVSKVAPASTTFSGYLTGPTNQQSLTREQVVGNVGLQVSKTGLGQSSLGQKLLLGLRAGYLFPLNTPNWETNAVSLSGGPGVNPGGTYLSLVLGSAL